MKIADFNYKRPGHFESLRLEAVGVIAYVHAEDGINDDGGRDRVSVAIVSREDAVRMAAWLLAWATSGVSA